MSDTNGTATAGAVAELPPFRLPTSTPTYLQLCETFGETHTLPGRGGSKPLTYLAGEQCVTRLNEVLGFDGWAFQIVEHGITEDHAWVLGRITFLADELPNGLGMREQFGSQQLKRSNASGNLLDLGFDLKGAATDALKKCASLIGVGLYLSHRDGLPDAPPQQQQGRQPQRQANNNGRAAAPAKPAGPAWTAADQAVEDEAKKNPKPPDVAFLQAIGQIRMAGSEEKLRSVADHIKTDIANRTDRAQSWPAARQMASRHLIIDRAAELGFRFKKTDGNASQARQAPNPGTQPAGVASGAIQHERPPESPPEQSSDEPNYTEPDSWAEA